MVTRQWSFLPSLPLLLGLALNAAAEPREIALNLGEYRFTPPQLEVVAGEPLVLRLTNTDSLTPHNLSLAGGGLELDVDVPAGQTLTVEITPREPGRHDFFCNKKLPFLKSHHERGMEGVLLVRPAP
jgi:plastocyanin